MNFFLSMEQKNFYSTLPNNLTTGEEICSYFKTTNNAYTAFILLKESEKVWVCDNTGFEIHHKIPRHANGTDISENCIPLSFENHTYAHKLLYEVYGNYYDFCAYNMRVGKTAEGQRAFRLGVVNQMKKLKEGRFNSENQRACGLQNKGISKKPHAKNKYVFVAFQKGMFWISSTGEEIHIPPGSMKGVGQLSERLLFAFSEKQKNDYATRGSRSYIYVGLNKILSGWRDKKTNKCMFCVGELRLGGIYL